MRKIPEALVERYEAQGWWTSETLGDLIANGQHAAPEQRFVVHSDTRPFDGTWREVEVLARRLAAGLRDRGVGPGDVVVMQLPNWREAAVTFWASAFLGAVVVPVVHFYGRKELGHIIVEPYLANSAVSCGPSVRQVDAKRWPWITSWPTRFVSHFL